MGMELISRETIKPSAPTPPHLAIYPLSLLDNAVAPNSVPFVYFYPTQGTEAHESDDAPTQFCDQTSKISMLKKSLSEVLSIYYPLAGRLKDQLSIDCNDQGVSLLVARNRSKLSEILHNPTEALLNPLFPDELQWKDMGSSASLVAIQLNCFACGGMAITVCMSHKVGDASTLFNFINDWATLNRKPDEEAVLTSPLLHVGASLFPQGDLPVSPSFAFVSLRNIVCRRLVFEGSKIESLKAVVSSQNVENPTRVEVVVALIYKCAVSALRLNAKNALLRVTVNLRKRMVPPVPDKSIGNLVSSFYALMDKSEVELHELVSKTREGLSEFCGKYVKNFGDLSFVSEFLRSGQAISTSLPTKKQATSSEHDQNQEKKNLFFFGVWCRFSTYEADFGWGKPIWVTTSGCPVKNSIVLMDTRDGKGIEVVVSMEEKDMAMFERDVELLQYASLNPNRWTC